MIDLNDKKAWCDLGLELEKEFVSNSRFSDVTIGMNPSKSFDKVEKKLADDMIAAIDEKISSQLDAVIQADEFKKMESSWRGLKFLIDRTDFSQNIAIELISTTKDELIEYGFWEEMLETLRDFANKKANNDWTHFERFPVFETYQDGNVEIKFVDE